MSSNPEEFIPPPRMGPDRFEWIAYRLVAFAYALAVAYTISEPVGERNTGSLDDHTSASYQYNHATGHGPNNGQSADSTTKQYGEK
jgi:hypothetical protein